MLTLKPDDFMSPLSDFMKNNLFAVLSVSTIYAYSNGKKTDTIVGTKYTVANPDTFKNFDVKVNQTNPVITQEKVEEAEKSNERYWITFTNAMVRPSKIEYGNVYCTVTADSAKLDG